MHWSIGIVLLVTVAASVRLGEDISDTKDDTVTVEAEEGSTEVASKFNGVDAIATADVKNSSIAEPPCHNASQESKDSDEIATRKFKGGGIQLVVNTSPTGHPHHYTTEATTPYPYPPYPHHHYPPHHYPPNTRRPHWENHPSYHQPSYHQPSYHQPSYQHPSYQYPHYQQPIYQPYPVYPPYWNYYYPGYYPGYPGHRPPYYGHPHSGRPWYGDGDGDRDGDGEPKSVNLDVVSAEDKKFDEGKAPKSTPFFSFLNFGKSSKK